MTQKLLWDDLRLLACVIQAKSLASAARTLGVDHSTVSRRLAALEKALGTTLVSRGAEGAQLTISGQRIAPLLQEMTQLAYEIGAAAKGEAARVRVSMPSGFARFFAHDTDTLRERSAGIELELLTSERMHDVEEGEADLAVRVGAVGDDRLVARFLCTAGSSLYASPAYLQRFGRPDNVEDLRGHELIAYGKSLSAVPYARWMEAHVGGARVALRISQVAEMVPAALQGVGLALLPCGLADTEPGLVRLTPQVLVSRDVFLVYRRLSRLATPVRGAIEIVAEIILDHAQEIRGGEIAVGSPNGGDKVAGKDS